MVKSYPELIASFAALMVIVGPSMIHTVLLSSADLIPFLQAEESIVNVPVPVMYASAPSLILMAAPSKASATSASDEFSSSGFSALLRMSY